MCTVTFIPTGRQSYILTSNRDEKTSRTVATPPFIDRKKEYALIYPRDPQGGGTWIAADNRLNAVCLLNGAFKPYKPRYPYRHSRGLVVLELFDYERIFDFFDLYDLSNIEPFTLVIVHGLSLYEFRWDGTDRHIRHLPFDQPRIWSSVTLYEEEVIRRRENWFEEWIDDNKGPETGEILRFHRFGGEGNKNTDLVMEREPLALRTLSITSIRMGDDGCHMHYDDLMNDRKYVERLGIEK